MPRYLDFVTLDVFTAEPFTGNQLGVVFLPDDSAQPLTQDQKQQIAREFNYSESIFIHPALDATPNKRRIDIFMTDRELPFAGHPTIGGATWLLHLSPEAIAGKSAAIDTIITKAGEISLSNTPTGVVSAGIPYDAYTHKARFPLSELLRLHPSLASAFPVAEKDFPVFSVVRGMSQIFIEVPDLATLGAIEPASGGEMISRESVSKGGYLDEGWGGEGIVVTYFYVRGVLDETNGKSVIRTRLIAGSLEDAATGSAASALGAYLSLVEPNSQGRSFDYDFVQGVEMGRRSEIGVKVARAEKGEGIDALELKGTAVKICEGKILVKD